MDDPIKIIFKYKNNNRKLQHHIYVFIGDVPNNIMKILLNIQDKSLFDGLISISDTDKSILTEYYGDKWYTYFYNTYHIIFTIDQIRKNKTQENEIINKYGKVWYDTYIKKFEISEKPIYYNYEVMIKDEITRKEQKQRKVKIDETNDVEEDENKYTSVGGSYNNNSEDNINSDTNEVLEHHKEIYNKMAKYDYLLLQGGNPDTDEDYDERPNSAPIDKIDDNDDNTIEFSEGQDIDNILNNEELESIEEEELEKIYQEVETDSDIVKTSELIEQALNDEKIIKKLEKSTLKFDSSKDNLMYDESLKDLYYKNYVTTQYIFKDDTIKIIKNKICSAIKNNPKFEPNAYIIPTRQYLWSEYFYNNTPEKVMIGQKWIKRTDILNIDIEPNNNLRYYEDLVGNLKALRDSLRRYGTKIKYEDDEYNILYDYENYYTNNEVYMIDIYNELGSNYSPTTDGLKNLIDVYIKIYFKKIKLEDIKYILDYLGGNIGIEGGKNKIVYNTINNDLVVENEIMKEVERTRRDDDYEYLFKENHITQSVIRVNLKIINKAKIDLYRIFDEFEVNNQYPFIQYHTLDGQKIFKYNKKDIMEFGSTKDNIDVLSKWFENSPYGISFKVKVKELLDGTEKLMAINLNDTGMINYKIQWKEENMATIDDTKKTYIYVKHLIEKLNSEKNKITFAIPNDADFKYAFMNTIQKFELPGKFIINHNDLSEFARYFYPYIALVIEPRKRQSKTKKDIDVTSSKFGTYVRYKRVSKYENQVKIEQRILYFMRNYEYTNQTLANEISKQFNITIDHAMDSILKTQNKHPNLKKSRKILKKLENIPKYKPPGIGVDIQGKQRDRYKIRVSGARNREQLDRIITFMNILIYLYVETYLYKKPERQLLKDKLKQLTKIAKRRNKVIEIVDYDKEEKTVKQITHSDKKRLGFRPDKGQNGWTRSCQNSGTTRRRPQQYNNLDNLLKLGFKLNKEFGTYDKKVKLKNRQEVTIRAVGLESYDDDGNGNGMLYYSCDPTENGKYMYIGFLSRSNNPYGQPMPCCFKKDAITSNNKEKQDYFLKSIGKVTTGDKVAPKQIGEKLYILQDTNKIQDGRFGFLPKYLDYFFNKLLEKTNRIRQHYLVNSPDGYYFKYGTRQDDYPFMNAVSASVEMNLDEIKKILINVLEQDKNDVLFTALNNGDIRTSFITRNAYIDYIKLNPILSYETMNHILTLSGIINKNGINIILFKKETFVIRKTLEKEKLRDDFSIVCQNLEEIENLKNPDRDTIIILQENKNYYPITMITKESETRNFTITKTFKYDNVPNNIINHIYNFYKMNCSSQTIEQTTQLIAKYVNEILFKLNIKQFKPQSQIIDSRNKCKYLITTNATIIPVGPSGSIYNLPILKSSSIESKLGNIETTLNKLKDLYNTIMKNNNNILPINPIGVYYDHKSKSDVSVIGIMTELYDFIPVIPETRTIKNINKLGLIMEYRQLNDRVDIEITKKNIVYKIDDRILKVNYDKYYNESYQLFRLHLSNFLNDSENKQIKNKIEKIIHPYNKAITVTQEDKRNAIRRILFRLIDKKLLELFESTLQTGGKYDRIVYIMSKEPNLKNYKIKNNRELCNVNDKEGCNANPHCYWAYDNCYLGLIKEMVITFVNKISDELTSNEYKAAEILQIGSYTVSDIVDYNNYTQRPGQVIIKSTNTAINKVLTELFGKDTSPEIGKRRTVKANITDVTELNLSNPLVNMGEYYIQAIIEDGITLFRVFANCYSWLKYIFYDIESRNLGYFSNIQTDMANYFRSNVIDWLTDKNNKEIIIDNLGQYFTVTKDTTNIKNNIMDFISKISKQTLGNTNGVVEYFILNKLYNIPIIIYNKYNDIIYIIDDNIIYDESKDNIKDKKYLKYKDTTIQKTYINIKYSSSTLSGMPAAVEALYYK